MSAGSRVSRWEFAAAGVTLFMFAEAGQLGKHGRVRCRFDKAALGEFKNERRAGQASLSENLEDQLRERGIGELAGGDVYTNRDAVPVVPGGRLVVIVTELPEVLGPEVVTVIGGVVLLTV